MLELVFILAFVAAGIFGIRFFTVKYPEEKNRLSHKQARVGYYILAGVTLLLILSALGVFGTTIATTIKPF